MSGVHGPELADLLAAAVRAVDGVPRPGQQQMAAAVAEALAARSHLLVQAGTGTGKSLAYLVPALAAGQRVVVATATLALQAQLVHRDVPRTVDALAEALGRRPRFAMLKGRANYACLHRVHEGVPDEQGVLVEAPPAGELGREVARLRRWAAQTDTGDRDELVPGPSERAWAQVSVSARECLGASRCPYGGDCFAERARERAAGADLVVTNHALLAIDAIEGLRVLPEHQAVIVDEAHELAARVTGVATQELSAGMVDRAARRARPHLWEPADDGPAADPADRLAEAGAALEAALPSVPDGRLRHLPEDLAAAVRLVRDAAHTVLTATGGDRDRGDLDAEAARRQAQALVDEVHAVASRLAERSEHDVAWRLTRERGGPAIRVAPLSVAGLLRERLFGRRTVVLTSATLALGGGFGPVAARVGLLGPSGAAAGEPAGGPGKEAAGGPGEEPAGGPGKEPAGGPGEEPRWTGLDVGSPFDHRRQGVLYVARHLPPPGRDGLAAEVIDELAELVAAAGGRTLGLFSSRRAAGEAASALRGRLDVPVLLQGEDATAELVRRFAADARTCLFGTLSLWQGVDVPGSACQLVVIDRLPFPRPDDPLASAQQEAVNRAGGNGFLTVAASHAALLLAQGAGRLLRTAQDRGVVAVLDPRLDTARYAGFLRASLPPLWYTTDPAQVRRSLAAIDATAPAPLPVPPRPATPDPATSFDVGGLGDLVAS